MARQRERPRWLVTGAVGQLGGYVLRHLTDEGADVVGLVRPRSLRPRFGDVVELELTDSGAVTRFLRRYRPSHIVHLAGISSPIAAQRSPKAAVILNSLLTGLLAAWVAERRAWMLFASTDFVFDGRAHGLYRESDRTCPTDIYAMTKWEGEQEVLGRKAGAVARFSWLYGEPLVPRPTTYTRLIDALVTGDPVPVVEGEYRSPASLSDAARVIAAIGEVQFRGLLHVGGPERLEPKEAVRRWAALLGKPVTTTSLCRRELRDYHRDTSLRIDRLCELFPRHVPDAIPEQPPAVAETTAAPHSTRPDEEVGVIVLAHQAAAQLPLTLASLAQQKPRLPSHVVVAANGCSDDTAAVARRFRLLFATQRQRLTVMEISSPGRWNAINAAEDVLAPGPRIYMDQDVTLSTNAVDRIAEALGETGADFVGLQPALRSSKSKWTRACFRAWSSLQYVRESPATAGLYALSWRARRCLGQLPVVNADDKFARLTVPPARRRSLQSATYVVDWPEGFAELVSARRRYIRDNREIATRFPLLAQNDVARGRRATARRRLRDWCDIVAFTLIYGTAAVRERLSSLTRLARESLPPKSTSVQALDQPERKVAESLLRASYGDGSGVRRSSLA